MTLPEAVVERIDDGEFLDALPEDVRDEVDPEEEETVDPGDLDLAVSTGEVYPDGTALRAFATTLAVAAVLWPALLVAGGHPSADRLLAGDLPGGEFLSFTPFWYFAAALAVGSAVSASHWYVRRAPPEVRERLDTGAAGAFVTTALVGGVLFALMALGGWLLVLGVTLGAIAALLVLVVVLALSVPLVVYGLLKRNPTPVIVAVGAVAAAFGLQVLEAVWPSGIPGEYYALAGAYLLALACAAVVPEIAVDDDLEEYRTAIGEAEFLHAALETSIAEVEAAAPEDYPVEVTAEEYHPSTFATPSEAVSALADALELADAYERHVEAWAGADPDGANARDSADRGGESRD